ncbi:MAG TPA: BON domain-containing protein [Firmicutes bacterium]|nr:BON domain-containing protein [Bacillota bacterium]
MVVDTGRRDLEERIKQVLSTSPLAPYALQVRERDGAVYLQGVVDVFAEKEEAERLIGNIPGVKRVENGITVCTDGAINDEDIKFEVSEELLSDPQVPKTVGLEVVKGRVRLVGEVKNLAEKEAAMKAAGRARGVREVSSELQVGEEKEIDDINLVNQVKEKLYNHDTLLARAVQVTAKGGTVRLTGLVNQTDMEFLEELVSKVSGVKRIENEVEVRPGPLSEAVTELIDRLNADPFLRNASINYSWEKGQLIIEGEVHSRQEKRKVEKALHQVLEGMSREIPMVENRLRLVETSTYS